MRPLLITIALSGCSLRNILPGSAVVSERELAMFESTEPSGVEYTGPPRFDHPVLALQPFGLQYAVDVVIVSNDPAWSMHEYARLDTPEGSFWIAKDSDPSGRQTIVADVPELNTWMPEIPAPRFERPLTVDDRSTGDLIDVRLQYTNPNGDLVDVSAQGTMPSRPPAKRNGNTMGHSRDVVAAVLDIDRFLLFKSHGSIQIGESETKIKRVLGVIPFRSLLRQTQAGLATANYRLTPGDLGFSLTRPSPAQPQWPTRGTEQWTFNASEATHDNGIVRFTHQFNEGELTRLLVEQHGTEHRTFELRLQPALPDLRRPFKGVARSRFVMNVNGQPGHGAGYLTARWVDGDTLQLTMTPTSPRWLTDRPMQSTVHYNSDGTQDVFIDRVSESTTVESSGP